MLPQSSFDINPMLILGINFRLSPMIETFETLNSQEKCEVFEITCEISSPKSTD